MGRHFRRYGSLGTDNLGKAEGSRPSLVQRRKGKLGGISRGLSIQFSGVPRRRICKFPFLLG